eukprot:2769861-Alexandrium_andersonii.AAC.1
MPIGSSGGSAPRSVLKPPVTTQRAGWRAGGTLRGGRSGSEVAELPPRKTRCETGRRNATGKNAPA